MFPGHVRVECMQQRGCGAYTPPPVPYLDRDRWWAEAVTRQQIEFNDDSIDDVSIQYACNFRKKSSDASAAESRARYTHRDTFIPPASPLAIPGATNVRQSSFPS